MEGVEDTNTNLYPFNIINHTQGVKKNGGVVCAIIRYSQ